MVLGEAKAEVTEALASALKVVVVVVVVESQTGVLALLEQEQLLLARKVQLAHLFRQREKKRNLGLGEVAGGCTQMEFCLAKAAVVRPQSQRGAERD